MVQPNAAGDSGGEDERYGELRVDGDVVVYDRENTDAWIRAPADVAVDVR